MSSVAQSNRGQVACQPRRIATLCPTIKFDDGGRELNLDCYIGCRKSAFHSSAGRRAVPVNPLLPHGVHLLEILNFAHEDHGVQNACPTSTYLFEESVGLREDLARLSSEVTASIVCRQAREIGDAGVYHGPAEPRIAFVTLDVGH